MDMDIREYKQHQEWHNGHIRFLRGNPNQNKTTSGYVANIHYDSESTKSDLIQSTSITRSIQRAKSI